MQRLCGSMIQQYAGLLPFDEGQMCRMTNDSIRSSCLCHVRHALIHLKLLDGLVSDRCGPIVDYSLSIFMALAATGQCPSESMYG